MLEIKSGSLDAFFHSALETAKEMDAGKQVTPKHAIWVSVEDLSEILKPQRTALLQLLKKRGRIAFSDLMTEMHKTASSLNKDLEVLSRYQLVHIHQEANPGHGIQKFIVPLFPDEPLEFRARV